MQCSGLVQKNDVGMIAKVDQKHLIYLLKNDKHSLEQKHALANP